MRARIFMLIFLSLNLIAVTKTIIVKTDKSIDINKLKIYFASPDIYDMGIKKWDIEKVNKKTFSFTTRSNEIYIEYKDCITYKFENVQQIKGDTLTIHTLKLINYITADTIRTSVIKYKRDSTVASTTKVVKIILKKNLNNYIPYTISMNKTPFMGQKLIECSGFTSNSCTPYKIAVEQIWTGRQVVFVYKYNN